MPTPKGLRFPSSSGAVVVPADIQKLAEDVDGLLVPATGGTYSGMVAFTQPPNVPTPVVNTNAATKAYVDQVTVNHILDMAGTVGNLLTANQASGTDTLGDTTGFTVYSAATITSDLTPYSGTRSVKAVATGNAGMTFGLSGSTVTATVGQTYTAEVTTAATDAAASELILAFYDSGGTWIGQASKAYTGGGWRTVKITGVAPASTAAVSAYIYQTTTTAGVSTVYADCWGIWKGAGGQWAMPGTPIVHTGIRPNPANTAEVQIWNDATATWITV